MDPNFQKYTSLAFFSTETCACSSVGSCSLVIAVTIVIFDRGGRGESRVSRLSGEILPETPNRTLEQLMRLELRGKPLRGVLYTKKTIPLLGVESCDVNLSTILPAWGDAVGVARAWFSDNQSTCSYWYLTGYCNK
jgi:hypothetical protein